MTIDLAALDAAPNGAQSGDTVIIVRPNAAAPYKVSINGLPSGGTYTLPVASGSVLGGIKAGSNVTIASDGTLNVATTGGGSYVLPAATASALGGVKQGSGVTIAVDGTISATGTSGVSTFNTRTGAITLSAADVVAALTFTPYSNANTAGYQTAAQVATAVSGSVTTFNTRAGAVTLSSSDVTTALGFTPSSGGRNVRVVTIAGGVTVTATDYLVIVKKTTGAATAVTLEASPAAGSAHVIKDGRGDADVNAITIYPASGTIDGQTSFLMNSPYAAITLIYNGAEWSVV